MSSSLPLNGRNPELGGFSIGYVHVTSESTNNQVSSFSPVGTDPLPLCPVRHLWTAGLWVWHFQSVMSTLPLNQRMSRSLPFMVLKLSSPVNHLWTDETITLFSFPPSRPGVPVVMLIVNLWTTDCKPGIFSWSCPVNHLWTNRRPIQSSFVG